MADKPTVLVGLSGGVDSSVSAALLKQRGFRVVGGFIKNWSDSKDMWTGECQWRGERRDALRVAALLDIPLLTFDFEATYRERVVAELFRGYAEGVTPNPDVLCNEAIKFGLFADEARRLGIDFVATGHYARVEKSKDGTAKLLRGADSEKDQSYFLYRIPQKALARTLFPIGHLAKIEVRALARAFNLPVAEKPDSQGICFIGKLDMGEFLRLKIPFQPGDIVDPEGNVIGRHDGLDQYTVGQRHKIKVNADHAWYVAAKDRTNNNLIVVPDPNHPFLFATSVRISDIRWVNGTCPALPCRVQVQVRYKQPAVSATLSSDPADPTSCRITPDQPTKAVAPGQSAVIFTGEACLGGGVIGW